MFGDFSQGFVIGALIVLVVFGLLLLRPAPPVTATFGGQRSTFSTRVPPDAAFRALVNLGPGYKFTVVKSDEGLKRVLLGDGFSFTSWGFYYLVELAAKPDGGTEVSVASRSKAFQWGPLVTRARNKTRDDVQAIVEGKRA